MVSLPSSQPDADEKVNILLVDDRADKLLAHEVVLADLGQNLVRANSGREALRCLLKEDFAVILLDVNMPGMDGFETASLIRQRPRSETTPIIFISAVNDTENHVSRGYSLGAVDYILTPVVPEILRAKIAVFVDLFKKTEQIRRQAEEREEFIRAQAARKEAEAARAEAERANLAKDRFLAMLSHELRTPLTPVLTSLLAFEHEEYVPEAMRPSLEMIRRNVELEARLIDDLLDLTRIAKGKVQLSLEMVDAHVLLHNVLEICQSEIDAKKIALALELSATKTQLEADPARLQQIFWNLLKNAVKFTPEAGSISVRTRNNEAGEFEFQVKDSGVGIDAESLPKIFKAFEQGERARSGGLGLGLAISRALIETHNGHLKAESAGRGEGATFTAIFPISEAKVEAAKLSAAAEPVERKSLRILLVEDHEDTNRSLTQLLRRRGYEVEPAHNIAKALESASKHEFDILVSDIGLPDGTGVELMQQLSAERPIRGIALTGFGMEEDIRKSHDGGFYHHLIKPVDLNRLDSLIQKVAAA